MKNKIIKIIYIISFIPYIYILYSAIFGTYEVSPFEISGIRETLRYIFNIFYHFIYLMPIIPICLTIQMCYIFRKNPKTMFNCTFIPYLFGLLLVIQYTFGGGGTFLGEVLYGLKGFVIGILAILLCYVFNFPIIPLCLIFQISLIRLRNKKVN